MSENDRQQRMLERIQEDERLRGDLDDRAAAALIGWASNRVQEVTADPACPDAVVEANVQAVRAAARAAARSGERDPERLIALAESLLAQRKPASAVADESTTGASASAAPVPDPDIGQSGAPSAAQKKALADVSELPTDQVEASCCERVIDWLKRLRGGQ